MRASKWKATRTEHIPVLDWMAAAYFKGVARPLLSEIKIKH